MTTKQYLAALRRLELTPYSAAAAAALGVSPRRAREYAAGANIPAPVDIVLRLYLARGTLHLNGIDDYLT